MSNFTVKDLRNAIALVTAFAFSGIVLVGFSSQNDELPEYHSPTNYPVGVQCDQGGARPFPESDYCFYSPCKGPNNMLVQLWSYEPDGSCPSGYKPLAGTMIETEDSARR